MKYIFIDTNNLIYSAISSQKEHKIESLEKFKNVLKNNNAKLLFPEIVKIEFDRKVESVYKKIKEKLDSLKSIDLPPYLEEEKNKLFRTIDEISKDKDKKYQNMREEVESLLTIKNVQYIPFDSDVLVQSYKRGMKREKPFKTNDDSLRENFDFIEDASWINDALIIESLMKACNTIDKNKDTLLFCSNNTKDFTEYDKESDKHHLHPDIKKDIRVETKYYLRLPDMLEKEFMESLSKETKENIKEAEKFHGSLLEQVLKDRSMRERNLKEFIAAGMGQTGLLGEMAEARDKLTKDFAKVVEAQNKWDNALKIRRLGLVDWNRMSEQSGLFSENKKERDETESTSGSKNKDETTPD